MENLPIAKSLVRQIAKMPLSTAKLVCTLLIARETGETEMRFSANRLMSLASGVRAGGGTKKSFLPAIQSLPTDTVMSIDVKAKDLLEESGNLKKTIKISGPLISTSLYDEESGEVALEINPNFFPILDRTKSNWVTLDLDVVRKIRSDYAFKLYCWILVHLGGHQRFEFDWHLFGSGEKEESVIEYFGLEGKKGYRIPSDIKMRIFELYLPKLQEMLSDTMDLQWSYTEKKIAYPRAGERAKFTESIHITVTKKDVRKEAKKEEKAPKKERPNQDVGDVPSPNTRPVRPALNQKKNTTESDKQKPKKPSVADKEAPITTEIKTIADFYNETIEAQEGSDQAYSYSTISRYASPLLQSGWSVERICSLIEANRAYYEAVKHPEHVKKPRLVFNVEEERLDKLRPFMKPMREILVERYCTVNNGAICHIPPNKFWLLDYETQGVWLDEMPYEKMPKDIQEEYDRRYPNADDEFKELLARLQETASWASNGANEKAF